MFNVAESENFTAKYRAVLRGEEIKLFTPNDSISVYCQVNFDNQSLQKSAVDYFAVSILGGILTSVKAHFTWHKADIVEMEGKIWLNLANPLTLLGVRGYDALPKISDCRIKVFISSDLKESEFAQLTQTALGNCFIYNSLLNAFPIEIEFEQVL